MLIGPVVTYGADLVLADFETGLDGWVPNNWDKPQTYLFSYWKGVTSGNRALMLIVPRPGWTIAALVKFQDVYKNNPAALADLTAKWMAAKTLEVDITIDPGNWLARPRVDNWVTVSLVFNTQNGGWVQLPVISDSVNPNSPGGWDPVNFPKMQTRHIVYDLRQVNATLKAAGGPGAWFEIFAILNSGPAYEKGGAFYMDNLKLSGIPTITWVSFHKADDSPSGGAAGAGFTVAPDKGYTDLLKAQGYFVNRYVTTGTPDLAVINASDLVIISRSVSSGHYQNVSADTWNSVTAPMIICGGYVLRKNRMGFTTGNTIPDTTGDITLTVTDPTHPIFKGIQLTNGTMVNPYAGIVTYPTDGVTLARGISVNTDTPDDEAIVLATISAAGNGPVGGMIIAEWMAGSTLVHDGGAGTNVLGGHRLVLLTGSREAQGINSETAGMYDLYADGAKIFLNAVEYMLASKTKAIELVNPSFELPGVGKIKGWNGEGIGGTPAEDIPGWASDGAPADSGIETGWGATDGEYTAFLKAKDPMVYQLTDYVIQAGDVFMLKVDAKNNWQATKFMLIIYYDDTGIPIPVATKDAALTDTMQTFTLIFKANDFPDSVGKRLGIEFANSSPVADSWVGFDNVRLSVTSVTQ